MTSDAPAGEAYVWTWLPGKTEPVIAGRLYRAGDMLFFNYGRSYLERRGAISLYRAELPLEAGEIPPLSGLKLAGCIRDGAPDAWGRRVILNRKFGIKGRDADVDRLDELTYLLESGSDRIGALDFQRSPTVYAPRRSEAAPLEQLMNAARKVEDGIPLDPDLEQALFHGSSLGGARPKAMIEDDNRKFIAKFSAQNDVYSVVKAEFVAMRLAARAGLAVAPVRLVQAAGKDVLLVERFDRTKVASGWERKAMVSALTLLNLDEMMGRYASYETMAELIRFRFASPKQNVHELFGRLVFNVLCGNTDDHARNHAAFWDGSDLALTPAYDICPQSRLGREANQAMLIARNDRRSTLAVCLSAAPAFLLNKSRAAELIERQLLAIREHWQAVCDEAGLGVVDRNFLWGRQFLNPFAFDEAPEKLRALKA